MRIIHVTPYYDPATEWGGPVRSVAMLAEATTAAGASVEVVTTNARGSSRLPRVKAGTRDVRGVRVTYCRAAGPRRYFFAPDLVGELSRRIAGADVVHLHGMWTFPNTAAAAVCAHHGVPYVLSPRGSLDPWALRQKRWKKQLYMTLLERRTLKRSSLLHFTASDEWAGAPAEFRERPHTIVPNAVDLEPFLGIDRSHSAPGADILILGRIHPMKGFDILIPALRNLAERGSDARLLVAGNDEGGYRGTVSTLIARHGVSARVSFLGEVDVAGKVAALRRASLLVAPSYRENFGMAVAEAMASALPVVLSERVGIASDVAQSGAGLVVPLDPAELADAVFTLLSDGAMRHRMGSRGRELARAQYSASAVAQAMLTAYDQASARRT